MIAPPCSRPAISSDKDKILALLGGFVSASPQLDYTRMRTLVTPPFQDKRYPEGYVLEDSGNIVGFISTLFTNRVIDGKLRGFCNINSWIVDPEYRQYSILLLKPALAMSDHTLTCLTPSRHVYPILRRLGFTDLDQSTTQLFPRILKPLPSLKSLSNLNRIKYLSLDDRDLCRDKRQLIQDHHKLGLSFLHLTDGSASCLIAYIKTKSYRLNYAMLFHISNPDFFHHHIHAIRFRLWQNAGTLRIAGPTRLLGRKFFPDSIQRPSRTPPVYKCEQLKPEQIDNLYSELAILQDF